MRFIANVAFKQFTKWFFTLWFFNTIEKMSKKEQYDKKAEEKQNNATIMTSVDGKGTDFPVKLKL